MAAYGLDTLKTGRNLGLAALVCAVLLTLLNPTVGKAGHDRFYGMVLDPGIQADQAIPRLAELKVNTVRLRTEIGDWASPAANTGTPATDGALVQAGPLHKAGFRVVLQVASVGGAMPSYDRARAVFDWLLKRPGGSSVDVVEVLGAVTDPASDADAFSATLTRSEQAHRYVDGPLRAAWDVVHRGARKKVLGAAFGPWQQQVELGRSGVLGNPVTGAYLAAGYLDRVDYAGLAPALDRPLDQAAWVHEAVGLMRGTPVWVGEWRLRRAAYPTAAAYLTAMSSSRAALRDEKVQVACFAGFTEQAGSEPVVSGGLGGYQPVQPAFDTYRNWPRS